MSTEPAMPIASRLAFAVTLPVVLAAAALAWAQVVEEIRKPDHIAARGTPAAVVWSNRVFRTEAELAGWLRKRGVDYERWSRAHPAAVEVLRARDRAAAAARTPRDDARATREAAPSPPPRAERAAPAAGEPFDVTFRSALAPGLAAVGLLLALVGSVPERLVGTAGRTPLGSLLTLAAGRRLYLLGTAFLLGFGTLVGLAL